MDWDLDCAAELCRGTLENMGINIWKVFPFRSGNRAWILVLLKAYLSCLIVGFLLACILNSVEGSAWLEGGLRHHEGNLHALGDTALDECLWFVFCSMHSVGFGEFMPRGAPGRIIAMICCTMAYWISIFVMCIIMLAQLPGERTPTLFGAAERVFLACWPSYSVFVCIVLSVGATCGPYLSSDPYGPNESPTGMYWMWCTAHRMPYGDIWPSTPYSRVLTFPAAILGVLYMPYALALVAVRCPSREQHEALLDVLRERPEDALGRGYSMPKQAREVCARGGQQEFAVLATSTGVRNS